MTFEFKVFDTSNLIATIALIVASISLALNLSDRFQRRTNFRISDTCIYMMCIGDTYSHALLSFRLANVSSRPLALETVCLRLNKSDVLLPTTSIELNRVRRGIRPEAQTSRDLVALATALPIVVPAHGALQIDVLYTLKPKRLITDLLSILQSLPNKPCIRGCIHSLFSKEDCASLDFVLSVRGNSFSRGLFRDTFRVFEASDI